MGQGGEPATRDAGRTGRSAYALDDLAPRGAGPFADAFGLAGWSRPLLALGARIEALGPSPAPVFIEGETGTGKELIARALHRRSLRAGRPFLPHNFAAIPDSLVESELFGHVKGAFTGAHADRPGLFELAHGGTLFLDEIGDASHSVQTRLLRVLQEGEVRRVGDGRARRVDVRVIAATHRDLRGEVRAGRFRADLFYRLHVLTVRAPSLRERREDIPLLAAHALRRLHRAGRPEARGITAEAVQILSEHAWPGNVRELEAALERAAHGLAPGGIVTAESLGEGLLPPQDALARERVEEGLRGRTRALEAELIRRALERAGGNKTAAARALGLTRQGLWKKIRRLEKEERAGSSATACADPESL